MRAVTPILGAILALSPWFAPALAATAPLPFCPVLAWTTLGTAGGPAATPERSEPANLLVAGDQHVLVDTGDGTADQLGRLGLSLGPIHTVFISHHHMDHTGGLAAVIGLRWMNLFQGPITVYGPPGTKALVDGIVASMAPQARIGFGLGTPPPPPAASVQVIEIRGGDTVHLGDLTVTAVANSHFAHPGPQAADAPQSLSYRFALGSRSVTYTGDTGPNPAVTALARNSDLLVSEVIDLDRLVAQIVALRTDASPQMLAGMKQHLSTHHLTGDELGKMAAQAGVSRVVLTHFAIPPGPLAQSEPAIRAAIARNYSGPVDLATDLARFAVACR